MVFSVADVIMRLTAPERVLVELNPLTGRATEHHRAHVSIADGQGLGPFLRRLGVPKLERIICVGRERERRRQTKSDSQVHAGTP